MSIVDLLRQALTEETQRQGNAALVVWYDQDGTLASVAERALPAGVNLLRFDGSYLALRLLLEQQDPDLGGRWVVYIPESPPDPSWLRDWEMLGARWQVDLLDLLQRKTGLSGTRRLVDLLRGRPENARELVAVWDVLMAGQAVSERTLFEALLALAFGQYRWQLEGALLLFLNSIVDRSRLEKRGLWDIFRERIAEWGGWTNLPEGEAALRERLESAVLLSEFALQAAQVPLPLVGLLPTESKRPTVGSIATQWRCDERIRDGYVKAAKRVEHTYGLGSLLTVSNSLLAVETFPVVDQLWRNELRVAVAPDGGDFGEKAGRVGDIANRRSRLFWARQGLAPYWEPIARAAQLQDGCRQAYETAASLSRTADFVQAYSREQGWWRLDLCALELAAQAQTLSSEERACFATPAWRAYGSYLDLVTRRFIEAVQRDNWTPTQSIVWGQAAMGGKTAVFLVDALRYDLAQRLRSSLPGDQFEVTVKAVCATLPTVTEVGMSALLPGPKGQLNVGVDTGKLKVRRGNSEVGSHQGRMEWMNQHLGQRGAVLALTHIEQTDLQNVDLLVVESAELDKYGTFAIDIEATGLFSLLSKIARAVSHLRDLGFKRFTIATDHGFLFCPPGVDPVIVDAPLAAVRSPRFVVGGTKDGCLTRRSDEIGLLGSEVFTFPIGLRVFGIQGQRGAFLHGGLSLQEAIVPVLEIKAVTPVEKVAVVMDLPEQITSRIAVVTLRTKDANLFQQARRVIVRLSGKESDPVDLGPNQQQAVVNVRWLEFDDAPPQEATVQIVDADSHEVLQELTRAVSVLV